MVDTSPQPGPPDSTALKNVAVLTFVLSLLLAPLALVSLVTGLMLTGRRGYESNGAWIACLSVVVLVIWWVIATSAV